eukprot:COSAG03_NODE_88_length_13468_cov_4.757798_7_plen_481_part_00
MEAEQREPDTEPDKREPEPEPAEPELRACWVCLDDGFDESGAERPQPTGCACRGGSTTHVHVGCLAKFAQEKEETWYTCPTCEQIWTGPVTLALARRRLELAAGLPEEDVERLNVAHQLVQALRIAGQFEEALCTGRATLATCRRVYGPEHEGTLRSMVCLAGVHCDSGDPETALPLYSEVVAIRRRVLGAEHKDTLFATHELADAHRRMHNPHLALPLLEETVDTLRRTLGDDHVETLHGISNLATSYNYLGDFERALPLRKEVAEGRRRLLGGQHPDTLYALGELGAQIHNIGDLSAAGPVLQEAVVGLSALEIGVQYQRHLEELKQVLKQNTRCLADPGVAAKVQRYLHQVRLDLEARLPSAAATVVGVLSRPELNGAEVTIRRFLIDKGRYAVQLPPDSNGKQERINLKPANLVLVEGSAMVATGLMGAPELNGGRGIVECWLEEKGRYAVRLEGKRQKKVANLRPENCRADVLAI